MPGRQVRGQLVPASEVGGNHCQAVVDAVVDKQRPVVVLEDAPFTEELPGDALG